MTPGPTRLDRRIARFAGLARAVLWTESAMAAFWPALALVGLFVLLALFNVPTALPAWLHLLFLVAFFAILALSLRAGWRQFSMPAQAAAQRKVERDSALRHRPFETLNDRPAGGASDVSALLWRLHQDRKRAEIGQLRVAMRKPGLPERDPRAVRYLILIALVLGLVIAGPRSGRLIIAALTPQFTSTTVAVPVEAWIKPPAYTGLAPILLKLGDDKAVSVPTGSTLEAHVTGGSSVPRLVLDGAKKDFRHIDGGGFALTQVLTADGTLSIRRGWWSTLASWQIAIIPDAPPMVEFANPPLGVAIWGCKDRLSCNRRLRRRHS